MYRTASYGNVGNGGGPGNVGRIMLPMDYGDFDPAELD